MHFSIAKEGKSRKREKKKRKNLHSYLMSVISDSYVGCVAHNKVSTLSYLFVVAVRSVSTTLKAAKWLGRATSPSYSSLQRGPRKPKLGSNSKKTCENYFKNNSPDLDSIDQAKT